MKLCLVVPGGVDASGEYRVVPALLALIRRLSRRHEVHVFALLQEGLPGAWQVAGAQVHNIGAGNTRLRALAAIRREHRLAAFDLIHSIWSGPSGLVAVAAARLLGLRSLVHVAGGELVALRDIRYGGVQRWRGRAREQLVLRAAAMVTAPSAPIVQQIERYGVRALRVALGVDLELWPPRVPVRRGPQETARLIHVASLNRVKDQTTLLQATAALAAMNVPFVLDIVGEDTLGGEMQRLAGKLGIERQVSFHGFMPQHALRPMFEAAHLLLMSSRHEAGPLAVLEAAVLGIPTVGTHVGHIAEWASVAAVSVPVGDWKALAAATAELLADEPRRLRLAGEAARRAIDEDAEDSAQSFETLYQLAIAGCCFSHA
ncbi:MAG TPA: glycosyltransferase family 4 protein [Steroidobacteraceae bacterium]|jgi:glycosyltransferase involved in cell wall biosynthesis